jgi:hypothetical protein
VTVITKDAHVSKPTFAEIADTLGKMGAQHLFDEDGNINMGEITFVADADVRQSARLAAALNEASRPREDAVPDVVYHDEGVEISTRCKHDGIHLIEKREEQDPSIVVIPRVALPIVASELIDCMGRHAV